MKDLEVEIKKIIIECLNLEDITIDDIDSDEALFNDGLGLDSIDALELGLALKNKYAVVIQANDESIHQYFKSVATLTSHIHAHLERTEAQ